MKFKLTHRWIVPILILLFAFFINRFLGLLFMIGYVGYVLWSSRAGILSQIAIRKYRQGDLQGSREWFAKAAAIKRAGGTVLLSYALVLIKLGEYEQAQEYVEQASELELSEYNQNALRAMQGLLEWKLGSPRRAAIDLAELAESFRNRNLFGALGSLYISEGMLEDALRFNLEAYDFDPYDTTIADNLVRTHYLRGDVDEAEEILDTVIDREPLVPEPYINKALIEESRGELEEALQMAERARAATYSHLSYFTSEEIAEICDRIEQAVEDE